MLDEKTIVLVKKAFETHPEADTIYSTSNGLMFDKKTYAEGHANGLLNKTIKTFLRKDFESVKEDKSTSATLTVAQIQGLVANTDDLEALANLLAEEEAGANRKGALAAITSKIEALQAQEESEGSVEGSEAEETKTEDK